MKLIITSLLFLLGFGYIFYKFLRIVIKLKQPIVFPVTQEDLESIRIIPKKAVNLPILSHQKSGLLLTGITLLFILIILVLDIFKDSRLYSFFIIYIPFLFNFNQAWNLFTLVEEGVLCGGRFVLWKRIQSYHFKPIDVHSRFYGFSPEVNNGYELWITTKFSEVSCIVTSEDVKEKLAGILDERISQA